MDVKFFLEYIQAMKENHLIIKENPIAVNFKAIRLMTAHKAKGMEFENVFIIHLTDKHWGNAAKRNLIKMPAGLIHYQNITGLVEESETRRLFYVAFTRAKRNVYLTYAINYDKEANQYLVPSKFIGEISDKTYEKIDAQKYENKFDERLKLTFAKKTWVQTETMKDFLSDLVEKFILSATSLNAYLDCPNKFFLNQLLRVPKVKDFNQSYGTAVHSGLETFFKKYRKDLKLPSKTFLTKSFNESLILEILTDADSERALKQGSATLVKYYDFYESEWRKHGPPISCEYNFRYHHVRFGPIPISGIIDKIEIVDGNRVKITDYKTSAPKTLNQLLGKTKENRLSEYYQAYFYKLLSECDPLFKWQVESVEFDFLSPSSGKFRKVEIKIEPDDYEKFKTLVQRTHQKITKLDFNKNSKSCKKYNSTCEYFDLCQ